MKSVEMMNQLINTTGVKQKTTVRSKNGSSSSDQSSDFEKMLGQAGQQSAAAEDSSPTTTETVQTNASAEAEEPGTEQMELAAALVTMQPVIPVETFTPVEVEDIAPAGAEAVDPLSAAGNVTAETAELLPEVSGEVQQQAAAPAAAEQTVDREPVTDILPEETAAPEEAVERPVEMTEESTQADAGQEQKTDVSAETPKETADVKPQEAPQQTVVEDASAAAETPVFEGTESVPVKVADTGEPVAPEADDAAQKIAQRIDQAIDQGESTVELSLSPANLGHLTVTITRSGDGTLSIVMTTGTEKAAHLLGRHAESLQNLLTDGIQNVHVEVETRTHETQPQQFLNPEGDANQHHQQQHRQRKQEEERSDGDFLQQLRLGLVGLDG